MRPSLPDSRYRRQRGLSLVEMMISLVLGLVVVAAVYNMYNGTSRSARFTSGLQTMQENGRFGVSVLQKGFRLAGYSPADRLPPIDFDAPEAGVNAVVVQLQQAYDCGGNSTEDTDGLAINIYRHDAASQQITCEGNGDDAAAMPIVDGVEQFRVLYGIDVDGNDVPEQYVPFGHPELRADRVASLRFALLVSSIQPIRSRTVDERHVVLDEVYDTDDSIVRSVFASTVKLRNKR